MEHVVFSATDDGAGEEFRRLPSLEDAVRFVEHLRNDRGIVDSTVFAMTPVPLSFRTYYRVEVPGFEAGDESSAPADQPVIGFADESPVEFTDDFARDFASDSEEAEPAPLSMDVPSLLPDGASIPASRENVDAEQSLGYFAS